MSPYSSTEEWDRPKVRVRGSNPLKGANNMKKRAKKEIKPRWCLGNQEEFWQYYSKLGLTYKAIELNNWKKMLSNLSSTSENVKLALQKCAEEEQSLCFLKQEQDKKTDELLLVKEQYTSKRPKK